MSYVLSNHGPLLVAAQATDERALSRALKQIDDRLILALNPDDETGRHVWQILIRYSGDRPAHLWISWTDDHGQPLPLSSAILEKVKRLRDADAFRDPRDHNTDLRLRELREEYAEAKEIAADMLPRIEGRKQTVLHRGVHLRQARARVAEAKAEARRRDA